MYNRGDLLNADDNLMVLNKMKISVVFLSGWCIRVTNNRSGNICYKIKRPSIVMYFCAIISSYYSSCFKSNIEPKHLIHGKQGWEAYLSKQTLDPTKLKTISSRENQNVIGSFNRIYIRWITQYSIHDISYFPSTHPHSNPRSLHSRQCECYLTIVPFSNW